MIEVNNLTTNQIDENFVKRIAERVLKEEKKERNISIAFIGEEKMRKLNKKHRKKNKVTDVLAFGEGLEEIVICLREVKKNAEKFNSSFQKELARVLIHGTLHLLSYNHEKSEREEKKMKETEKHYLKKLIINH